MIVTAGALLAAPVAVSVTAARPASAASTDVHLIIANIDAFGGDGGLVDLDVATGATRVVATGGSFADPYGVAVDQDGYLLVADRDAFPAGDGGIIRVNPVTGAQTPLTSARYMVNPTGVVVAPDGAIYVVDPDARDANGNAGAGGVIKVDPETAEQTLVSSGGMFGNPTGIAVEPCTWAGCTNGYDLLVADESSFDGGDGGVIRVNPSNGVQTEVAGTSNNNGDFGDPKDLVVAPNGDVYVVDPDWDEGDGGVIRLSADTIKPGDPPVYPTVSANEVTGHDDWANPAGIALGPDGTIYVSDPDKYSTSSPDGAHIQHGAIFTVDPSTGAVAQLSRDDSLYGGTVGLAIAPTTPPVTPPAVTGPHAPQTFTSPSGDTSNCAGSYTVPAGVYHLGFKAIGQHGGAGGGDVAAGTSGGIGGFGGAVSGVLSVAPGETLAVGVLGYISGGDGQSGDGTGGVLVASSGDGGDASFIEKGSCGSGTLLAVAAGGGGGGGAGMTGGGRGGNAGWPAGGNGYSGGSGSTAANLPGRGGGGGTQTEGGRGGPATSNTNPDGDPGTFEAGGSQTGGGEGTPGGGGGGGYYGGGSGGTGNLAGGGGGGGGSSYLNPDFVDSVSASDFFLAPTRLTPPSVTLTPLPPFSVDSAVSVTVDPAGVYSGAQQTLKATVTPAPSTQPGVTDPGTVTFKAAAQYVGPNGPFYIWSDLGTAPVDAASGVATLTYTFPGAGLKRVTATYNGIAQLAPATSAPVNDIIYPPDHAPVAVDDVATTPAGTAVSINVLDNDSDADGDQMKVVNLTDPAHGTVTRTAGGTAVTYTPDPGYIGSDSFIYQATDQRDGPPSGALITSTAATVTVSVTGAPPTWQSSSGAQGDTSSTPSEDAVIDATPGSPITITISASPPDGGGPVTLAVLDPPTGSTFTTSGSDPDTGAVTGTFTWIPTGTGQTPLTFTATSGGTTVQRHVTIDATKKAPTITWSTPESIVYGTPIGASQLDAELSHAAGAPVPPHDGILTYDPEAGTVLGAGDQTLSVTWTPDSADAAGWDSVTATVTLHVSPAPQSLSFDPAIDDATTYSYGDAPFTVKAVSSAGLPVSYRVGDDDACTASPQESGSVLITITGAGSCTLTVTQTGNGDYQAASPISHSFTVVKKTPTIALTPEGIVYGTALGADQLDATITPTDAADKGTISYTVDGRAVPEDGILDAGTHTLTATFTPDPVTGGNYNGTSTSADVIVAKAGQSIAFDALADKTFGHPAFDLTASATSGLVVTFTGQTPQVCTVTTTGLVSLLHAGTCTVAAEQAGDGNYYPAPPVPRSFTVAKARQTIAFASPGDQTYGGAPVSLQATGGDSGNPVSFAAGPATVCAITGDTGSTLSITGAGDCTVTASQAGTSDYLSAPDVSHTITIAKATPTITWTTPSAITYGTPLGAAQLDATVQPGIAGTFTYTLADGTTDANGAILHASAHPQVLHVTFTPSAPDEANYTAATGQATIQVDKANQVISWTDVPSDKSYGDAPFDVTATGGGSGNPVTFTVAPGGSCAVSGSTVTITGAGTCVLNANQSGNADFNAAPTSTRSLTVTKRVPAISWQPPGDIVYGAALSGAQLNATVTPDEAASNGTLTYATDAAPGDATGQVLHAGQHMLTVTYLPDATDVGNDYTAATASVWLTVQKATQTIAFGAIAEHTFGDAPITLTAVGGKSGDPVTFTVASGSRCAVSGDSGTTLILTGAGTCTVTAHQEGSADYLAATPVTHSFTIDRARQTINFDPDGEAHVGDRPVPLTATGGGSGNPVTFTAGPAPVCTTTGTGMLTVIGSGACTITASQAGDDNYLPAAPVIRTVTVSYRTCATGDDDASHPDNGVLPLTVTVCDAAGLSLAEPAIVLHATGIDDGDPATGPGKSQPGNNFRYTRAHGGGYHYNLVVAGLSPGEHKLTYTITGDPTVHAISFSIKQT